MRVLRQAEPHDPERREQLLWALPPCLCRAAAGSLKVPPVASLPVSSDRP